MDILEKLIFCFKAFLLIINRILFKYEKLQINILVFKLTITQLFQHLLNSFFLSLFSQIIILSMVCIYVFMEESWLVNVKLVKFIKILEFLIKFLLIVASFEERFLVNFDQYFLKHRHSFSLHYKISNPTKSLVEVLLIFALKSAINNLWHLFQSNFFLTKDTLGRIVDDLVNRVELIKIVLKNMFVVFKCIDYSLKEHLFFRVSLLLSFPLNHYN